MGVSGLPLTVEGTLLRLGDKPHPDLGLGDGHLGPNEAISHRRPAGAGPLGHQHLDLGRRRCRGCRIWVKAPRHCGEPLRRRDVQRAVLTGRGARPTPRFTHEFKRLEPQLRTASREHKRRPVRRRQHSPSLLRPEVPFARTQEGLHRLGHVAIGGGRVAHRFQCHAWEAWTGNATRDELLRTGPSAGREPLVVSAGAQGHERDQGKRDTQRRPCVLRAVPATRPVMSIGRTTPPTGSTVDFSMTRTRAIRSDRGQLLLPPDERSRREAASSGLHLHGTDECIPARRP